MSCDHGAQAWPRARADSDRAEREGASGPGGLHIGVGGGSNQREEADTRQPGPRRPLPRRCLRHFGNTAVCGLAGIPGRRHWMGTKGHWLGGVGGLDGPVPSYSPLSPTSHTGPGAK